jgi:3-oxoacyl-[acyl-carrier protein] reductase
MNKSNSELNNSVALVTGGSKGIGRAIALELARAGADLILCASKEDALEEFKIEVEGFGNKVWCSAFDATDGNAIKAFFSNIVEKVGQLDILVNNVGGVRDHAKFEELSDEQWINSWNLNFMTTVHFSREALPWLRKSKSPRIINIASSAGKQPGRVNPHYGSSKAAINYLSKYLSNELGPEGILVNAICPSTVSGGSWAANIKDKAGRMGVSISEATRLMEEEVVQKTPLGKIVEPKAIGELVVFLASDRARFITGSCIAVDGGMIKSIF